MRVAHLIHGLEPGGAEALLVDLARAAPGAGLEIAVMPLVRVTDDRYVRALRDLGVPVLGLDLPTRWDPRAFGAALRRLRGWRPDVLHTHLKHADLVGAVAARVTRTPQVSTLHVIEDGRTPMLRAKRRLAAAARLSTARATITVSDAQRRWYLGAFPSADPARVVTVPNGVADPYDGRDPDVARAKIRAELGCAPATWPATDPGRADGARESPPTEPGRAGGARETPRTEPGRADGEVLIAQVAVARPGKGHATLLDALRRLPDLPVRLAVAGDGPLRAELEAGAADLGDRVRFLGHRDDVPDLLAAADIVAHPSEFEALPTALIEALGAGRPVVATEVGGIPEVVTAETAAFVPVGDAAALAAELRALAADPQRRAALGAAARRRFEARFDARVWARRLADLYADVLQGGAPRVSSANP